MGVRAAVLYAFGLCACGAFSADVTPSDGGASADAASADAARADGASDASIVGDAASGPCGLSKVIAATTFESPPGPPWSRMTNSAQLITLDQAPSRSGSAAHLQIPNPPASRDMYALTTTAMLSCGLTVEFDLFVRSIGGNQFMQLVSFLIDDGAYSLQLVFDKGKLHIAEYSASGGHYMTHSAGVAIARDVWQHVVLSTFGSLGNAATFTVEGTFVESAATLQVLPPSVSKMTALWLGRIDADPGDTTPIDLFVDNVTLRAP